MPADVPADEPADLPGGRPADLAGDVPADVPGGGLVRLSWWATAVFAAVAVAATVAPTSLGTAALTLDVALFAAGCVLFVVALLRAADRSRTEAIGIGGLFFLAGDVAPPAVRRHLLGALAVQTAVGLATAGIRLYTSLAAGTLVPVFGLGLCGLWAARYGRFGPRTARK